MESLHLSDTSQNQIFTARIEQIAVKWKQLLEKVHRESYARESG